MTRCGAFRTRCGRPSPALERRLSFKVTVPVAGTYYVIVDNRKGAGSRKIRLLIEALRPHPSKSPPKRPDERRLQAT